MIDTVKIYTMVNKEIYNKIYHSAIIKSSYNLGTGEIFYEIVNDHLSGSYDNRLSVRVGSGVKYQFVNNYYLEIEGNPYLGILGVNGVLTDDGKIFVLGWHSFMQDCDASAILEILDEDLYELFDSCIIGSFSDED